MRVRQIVLNFLSNAIKFTDAGRVSLTARRLRNGRFKVAVKDTGIGISPSGRAKIFGRFEEADSSITRRFGGSGLGLSISHELAMLMEGRLDCDSTPGVGSTFWVELPLEPALGSAAQAEPNHADAELKSQALRILLVDDNEVNRRVAELMLEKTGASVTSREDGQQAVLAYTPDAYDLIPMDMADRPTEDPQERAKIRSQTDADHHAHGQRDARSHLSGAGRGSGPSLGEALYGPRPGGRDQRRSGHRENGRGGVGAV